MRRFFMLTATAALALGTLFGSTVGAAACNGNVTSVGGLVYLDDRYDGDLWIYLESGDAAGLQSGGTHIAFGYTDDCQGGGSDILVY